MYFPLFNPLIFTGGGGSPFRRISAVVKFLSCTTFRFLSHPRYFIHYIIQELDKSYINLAYQTLTNSLQNGISLLNRAAMFTLAWFQVLLITQRNGFVRQTTSLDNYMVNVELSQNIIVWWVKNS